MHAVAVVTQMVFGEFLEVMLADIKIGTMDPPKQPAAGRRFFRIEGIASLNFFCLYASLHHSSWPLN